jgi:type VI secretion system secreted protein Hcp
MVSMQKKILWVAAALVLIATPAVIGVVALSGDDDGPSAARRAGAFVALGAPGTQLTIEGGGTKEIMKPSEAIDVESWSWGVSNTGTAYSGSGGATAGKAQLGDLQIVKKVDKASPKLFLGAATGTLYTKATLRLNKGTEKASEYLVITLEDVLITGVQLSGAGGTDLPSEQVTLNYAKATIEVTETEAVSPVMHYYDLRTAKAG